MLEFCRSHAGQTEKQNVAGTSRASASMLHIAGPEVASCASCDFVAAAGPGDYDNVSPKVLCVCGVYGYVQACRHPTNSPTSDADAANNAKSTCIYSIPLLMEPARWGAANQERGGLS